MDVQRRDDRFLDEISRLHREHRNQLDYLTTALSVLLTQSEDGMRSGIEHLLRQLQPAELVERTHG